MDNQRGIRSKGWKAFAKSRVRAGAPTSQLKFCNFKGIGNWDWLQMTPPNALYALLPTHDGCAACPVSACAPGPYMGAFTRGRTGYLNLTFFVTEKSRKHKTVTMSHFSDLIVGGVILVMSVRQ